ncbi:MAG: 30S ribosomal protein S9 [Nanoarchaeota archaeon]|nr:30S ribosomal protein S9 [Nanoarchaeota archaeon]
MVENKDKKIIVSGKRKRAVARATIKEGNGQITINNRNYKTLDFFDKLRIEEPLRIAHNILGKINFDVEIKTEGGGARGQIEAARLALARAIVKFTKSTELEDSYFDYDRTLLVADVRRKESRKPGDSKARAKRQKSYR